MVNFIINPFKGHNSDVLTNLSKTESNVLTFHKSIPGYQATPLYSLASLSRRLEVHSIYVKDESQRFGLNAFKGLGGSFAIAKYLAKRLKMDALHFEQIKNGSQKTDNITFCTATDGNHGKGVAWTASLFGHRAVVFMPKGSSITRKNQIENFGAKVYITDMNYDDTVRMASDLAAERSWVLIQDTAWDGYQEIPAWIMQGYMTIVVEVLEQLQNENWQPPTHVFLQAGVGSFAASIEIAFLSLFNHQLPTMVVIEPQNANCFFRSVTDNNGAPFRVTGDLSTMMAGLACGEPNPLAWTAIKQLTHAFVECEDPVAARGMRILGNPLGTDHRIVSGESGAVGMGVLFETTRNPSLREALQLNNTSRILLISTEGDTDPVNYRDVVWNGYLGNIE